MSRHHASRPPRGRRAGSDGFTLIELLVVTAILGILAAIVVFAVKGIGDEGKANAVKADAAVLRTAEEAHCAKVGHYATIDELKDAKFLASDATYNSVALGDLGTCGTGPESSFQLFDSSTPTGFVSDPASAIHVGSDSNASPADVAINPKTDRVYVTNSGDNSVSVINGSTDARIDADPDDPASEDIPVGSNPANIAVNPANDKIYVSNVFDGTVSVIDGSTNTVVSTAPTGGLAQGLVVNPVTNDVFVLDDSDGTVSVIDGTSNDVSTIQLDSIASGAQPIVSKAANKVFISDGGDHLEVIDGSTHHVTSIALPAQPAGTVERDFQPYLAVNERTNKVYGVAQDTVTVNDGAGAVHLRDVGQLVTFDGANGYAPSVTANGYDVAQPTWSQLVANPITNQVLLYGELPSAQGAISRYDAGTQTLTGQATGARLGHDDIFAVQADEMVLNANTNRVYLTQSNEGGANGGLLTLDLNTMLTSTIGTGRVFYAFAVDPLTNKIYAADYADGTVAVLR